MVVGWLVGEVVFVLGGCYFWGGGIGGCVWFVREIGIMIFIIG